jgi:hypothetical protein
VNQTVISSLLPVVLLIALGLLVGKRGWIRDTSVKDLSNLVFLVLSPALLFHAMSTVRIEQLSLRPVAAYFLGAFIIFGGTLLLKGFNRVSVVTAIANTYSNTAMIGIPLIGLAYGAPGMVTLLTLVSLHSLVLLSLATVAVELAQAREQAISGQGAKRHILAVLGLAVRNAIVHPVPIPIIVGLLWAQTGWRMPEVIDKPIQWLGQAFGPLALVMVGVTLAQTRIGTHFKGALALAVVKNLLHPALVVVIGWMLGLTGLPLTVMVVAAALPMGANVFLFAQRYRANEDLITAAVAVSTATGILTLSLVMFWVG